MRNFLTIDCKEFIFFTLPLSTLMSINNGNTTYGSFAIPLKGNKKTPSNSVDGKKGLPKKFYKVKYFWDKEQPIVAKKPLQNAKAFRNLSRCDVVPRFYQNTNL